MITSDISDISLASDIQKQADVTDEEFPGDELASDSTECQVLNENDVTGIMCLGDTPSTGFDISETHADKDYVNRDQIPIHIGTEHHVHNIANNPTNEHVGPVAVPKGLKTKRKTGKLILLARLNIILTNNVPLNDAFHQFITERLAEEITVSHNTFVLGDYLGYMELCIGIVN